MRHVLAKFLFLSVALLLVTVLVACKPVQQAPAPANGTTPASDTTPASSGEETTTLIVASHDSFAASDSVISAFEKAHHAKVQILELGDAGEALNKIILSKDAPIADLLYGVDNTFLSRALDAGIFIPYDSPLLKQIPDELKLDSQNSLLPVDTGYVNVNADRAWFDKHGIPVPATLEELADPKYKGLLVVLNPATSSPGLAFLLATIAHFGTDKYLDYWKSLRANDTLVVDDWETAYFTNFTAGSGGTGDKPLVISYTSSPPADVVYATDGRTEPYTVNISPDNGTFRQIEFVGILKGTKHLDLAKAWVDYMLDVNFQNDMPLQMYVYPTNKNATLPELFTKYGQIPAKPVVISPADIDANRDAWITAWTDTMLH